MSNILSFTDFKNKKKEPVAETESESRVGKIRSSLDRINQLMSEIKQMSGADEFTRIAAENEAKKKKLEEERRKANEGVKKSYRLNP